MKVMISFLNDEIENSCNVYIRRKRRCIMMFLPTFSNVFDDLFSNPSDYSSIDAMRTDVVEKATTYEMSMELPGYKKEDIQMELKDGYLLISATRQSSQEQKDSTGHVIRRERYSGSCSRKFYVGDIRQEDIKASFDNGELNISVPKAGMKKVEEKKYITID